MEYDDLKENNAIPERVFLKPGPRPEKHESRRFPFAMHSKEIFSRSRGKQH
jgi:hypothetical protein